MCVCVCFKVFFCLINNSAFCWLSQNSRGTLDEQIFIVCAFSTNSLPRFMFLFALRYCCYFICKRRIYFILSFLFLFPSSSFSLHPNVRLPTVSFIMVAMFPLCVVAAKGEPSRHQYCQCERGAIPTGCHATPTHSPTLLWRSFASYCFVDEGAICGRHC